jgi:ATP-dependent helicase HepA
LSDCSFIFQIDRIPEIIHRELFVSKNSFVPGQRWVSNTESELGLGIVVDVANRRVEISFPAAGERRTYAIENAPISRVRYEIGQKVSNEENVFIEIAEVLDNGGCLIYSGNTESGENLIYPELCLNSFVQFSKPQDRLFAGQIDKNRAFQLRYETLEHIRHQQQSPVRGLLGPRVQLLPHQLYIASEAASRYAPRVLLADEVGLGKTIEAGLILHQQLISGRTKRVLIILPDSLLHQWLVEMLRRFNLFFTILDEDRCQGLEESGEEDSFPDDDLMQAIPDMATGDYNPFESAQLVLCTLSFLTKNPNRQKQALAAQWDMLIVDEAHHLLWSESEVSKEYQCVESLAKQARGLLLLTATPEQLGIESHFARLRLLDPDRYYDLEKFISEEKMHQPVNSLVQQLLAENAAEQLLHDKQLTEQLIAYLGDESVATAISLISANECGDGEDASEKTNSPSVGIAQLIRDLLDRHGTGRVLFRNTRSSVTGFPERKLNHYPLKAADRYSDLLSEKDIPVNAVLAPELLLGNSWIAEDPRVEWLSTWLKQHRSEKILVICAQADTALDLEEHLRLRGGVQSSVFHEGLSLIARDRAAAYFADDEDGAQVLICSEIGSEGRNFQFSHHLVLFDLPLNPDLLEQRIGRLDRIGQRHTVDIHVPYYEQGAQQVLLRWYHEGINAFEKTCPAGLALYQQFESDLLNCLQRPEDVHALELLLQQTKEQAAVTLDALQRGRDRLLELNSCNHETADEIVSHMVEEERRQELSSYMEQVFDQFGVEQEHHSATSVILRPGDHMLTHSFPALPDDGITATFSREVALSREDLHYLTWEHPMVSGSMDMVLSGEFGNTAFCTLKLPPLKPGTVLLEAIYVLHCTAPSELQLQRHLPLTTVRIVIDSNYTDLSNVLTAGHINKLGQKVRKRNAQDLIRHARPQITTMIDKAGTLAEVKKTGILTIAETSMQTEQTNELQRLQALSKVNTNIRQEEIIFLQDLGVSAHRYLQGAQLKLDAVRVALVTE